MTGKSLTDLIKMQRNQLKSVNKDELIDAILSAGDTDAVMATRIEVQLSNVAKELSELRQTIAASEDRVNKKLTEMQEKIDKQANIISQQQLFLESVDAKQRETNIVITGVPDDLQALEGATSDDDKIGKVWEAIGDNTAVRSHRRLGRPNPAPDRHRPILVVVGSKTERDNVLKKSRKTERRRCNLQQNLCQEGHSSIGTTGVEEAAYRGVHREESSGKPGMRDTT